MYIYRYRKSSRYNKKESLKGFPYNGDEGIRTLKHYLVILINKGITCHRVIFRVILCTKNTINL